MLCNVTDKTDQYSKNKIKIIKKNVKIIDKLRIELHNNGTIDTQIRENCLYRATKVQVGLRVFAS